MWAVFAIVSTILMGVSEEISLSKKSKQITPGKMNHMLISTKANQLKSEYEEYCRKSYERYKEREGWK